jgi:MHS family proline/betaine transporter-like MFS transporter
MPTYLSHNLHYSEDHGVLIIIVVMIGMLFVQPVVGWASDRVGRRPFIAAGSLGLLVGAVPAFHLITSGNIGLIFVGLLLLAVLLNCLIGVMASTLPAMFPTRVRYSALATAFNISVIICGVTPTAAAWLVEVTGDLMMPAYYLMAVALVGLLTAWLMRETANRPLRGDTPNASSRREARELLQQAYDHIEASVGDLDVQIEGLQAKIDDLQQRKQVLVDRHPDLV